MKIRLFIFLIPVLGMVAYNTVYGQNMIKELPNGHHSLMHKNIAFEIDPDLGARIISAKIDENEVLLQERDGLQNWGSTFWPSPQSQWNWPPPREIHLGKYTADIHGAKLKLQSETDLDLGISVIKWYSFNEQQNCLEIEYQIKNDTDSSMQIGPWEIVCVPAENSNVFFPLGESPENVQSTLEFEDIDGIGWFEYNPDVLAGSQKIFNNAKEGWLAYINENNTLFVKSFPLLSSSEIAPGQGNVEVYVSKTFKYIELENHGKYTLLKPGESLEYTVRWYLLKIPESISNDSYSDELIDFVKSIID